MSVDIEPFELSFQRVYPAIFYVSPGLGARAELHTGPFTKEVAQILKIKNPNSSPVAFKVGRTAGLWCPA
jgi:hypothetical protein